MELFVKRAYIHPRSQQMCGEQKLKINFKEFSMKSIILALVALGSVSAFAFPSADQSWDQIFKTAGVTATDPFSGFGSVFNMCATETEFRTINQVDTCTEWKEIVPPNPDQQSYWICASTGKSHLSMPRTRNVQVCVKEAPVLNPDTYTGPICLQYETRSMTYPTTFTLQVWYDRGGESSAQYLFSKDYTLAACAN